MTSVNTALSDTDRRAIEDLILEHAWLLDHCRWHDVAELYLENGTLTVGTQTLVGRDQFHRWADTGPPTPPGGPIISAPTSA
ncbi:nuclear transport factor 2 family protein [Mycolicibacter algericus]|uniref:SnoaL-like domain-containing protein n=1 Tax=Mycolicibacter algericus TaxID=1288388 RepID=A0A7I9YAA2_MYCAL|nr:hypothetical protein MALGJ_22720 [Mycolicibacter algericus]